MGTVGFNCWIFYEVNYIILTRQNVTQVSQIIWMTLSSFNPVPCTCVQYIIHYSPVTSSVMLLLVVTVVLELITTSHWYTLSSSDVVSSDIV